MKIAIGVTTRRRPMALAHLLASFAALERPADADLVFLLCENDTRAASDEVIAAFRRVAPGEVVQALEPRRGIPHGRNRVLDMASAAGAEYLLFVDDDEAVAPDWLCCLLGAARRRGLDLAGGPVMPEAEESEEEGLSALARAILQDQDYRLARQWRKRAEMVRAGDDSEVDAYTNNWCLRLDAARVRGLRFDPEFSESGGEDTAFCQALREAGGRIGWVPEAQVREVIPARRLRLGYQFARMRDQVRMQIPRDGFPLSHSANVVCHRMAEALLLAMSWPVVAVVRPDMRWTVPVRILRKCAITAGHVSGALGARSTHYADSNSAAHEE